MDKRDKGYTLYKKGLSCTEISKKLDVSINTVKSWRKRYWTQGADAPFFSCHLRHRHQMHPQNAPCTQRMHPPHLTLKQDQNRARRREMSMPLEQVRQRETAMPSSMVGGLN